MLKMWTTKFKDLPDKQKITVLKCLLGLTAADVVIWIAVAKMVADENVKITKIARQNRQIVDIFVENTDFEANPELYKQLREYVDFVEIVDQQF